MALEREDPTGEFEDASIEELTSPSPIEIKAKTFAQEIMDLAVEYYPHLRVTVDTEGLLRFIDNKWAQYDQAVTRLQAEKQKERERTLQEDYLRAQEHRMRAKTEQRIARNLSKAARQKEVETATKRVVEVTVVGQNEYLIEDFHYRVIIGTSAEEDTDRLVDIYEAALQSDVEYSTNEDGQTVGKFVYEVTI